MKSKKHLSVICYIPLFTVLICLCTWIQIPFAIPFTLQTFAVFSALFCLGGKRGSAAIILYILAGIIGLPVFSGFMGGFGVIFGATGGFILGFLLSGIVYTALEKIIKNKLLNAFISLFICYCSGTVWFFTVYSDKTGLYGLFYTLCIYVIPFIIPDIIKLLLAFYISKRLEKHLLK